MRLMFSAVVEPLHDAVVEDLLDNAEREATGSVARPASWSPRVRVLRRLTGAGSRQARAGRMGSSTKSQHRARAIG